MKIIILAAGKGERLWPLTKEVPKPLVDLGGGVTLLDEQIRRIKECGAIQEVVIVTGYLGDKVDEHIKRYRDEGLKISTEYNPFYEVSNNLASLWMARHHMAEDFMVTNGDNLFNAGVFRDFVGECQGEGIYLSLGQKDHFDDDDMKVTLLDEKVVRVSKEIAPNSCHAESPGLCLINGSESRALFRTHLEKQVKRPSGVQRFWLEVFNGLANEGEVVKPWYFDAATRWREVDIHPDIGHMRQFLSEMMHLEEAD